MNLEQASVAFKLANQVHQDAAREVEAAGDALDKAHNALKAASENAQRALGDVVRSIVEPEAANDGSAQE